MALTRAEERSVLREAAAAIHVLSAAWRDDLLKRKNTAAYDPLIVQARNDALQTKVTIALQREVP